jgi:hypothetical protein
MRTATDEFWDEQVSEFPTPLCERCNVPKWVNKRYFLSRQPLTVVRIGYECRLCAARKLIAGSGDRPGSAGGGRPV